MVLVDTGVAEDTYNIVITTGVSRGPQRCCGDYKSRLRRPTNSPMARRGHHAPPKDPLGVV